MKRGRWWKCILVTGLLLSVGCGDDERSVAEGAGGADGDDSGTGGATEPNGVSGEGEEAGASGGGAGQSGGSGDPAAGESGGGADSGTGGGAIAGTAGGVIDPGAGDTTVFPDRIDDVLINPGMGLANFHLGWWCNLPPITYTPAECAPRVRGNWPENHPDSGTAYFRWHWRDIEPVQGEIDFDMIDAAIQSANALNETLSFRVMTIADDSVGIPDWLQNSISGQQLASPGGTTYWPDYRDAAFQSEHARMVAALGARYDGHPAVDHIDIGSVGCWGEWNTACLNEGQGLFGVFDPPNTDEEQAIADAYRSLISDYTSAFSHTPLVMLGFGAAGEPELDIFLHAVRAGTGWRVDCWGDWGVFSDTWNHQESAYPNLIEGATAAYPEFATLWQRAPIQLEVCATLPDWAADGWSAAAPDGEVYKTFEWALEQHASVLNAKWTDIPAEYGEALDELLRRNGYRFVIDSFNHDSELAPGAELTLTSSWSNIGVAPIYLPRTLSYRFRGATRSETFTSSQDLQQWLPGSWSVNDNFSLPADLPSGTYALEVAIVDRAGQNPTTLPLPPLFLSIEGRGSDGWYAISQVTVP